MLDVHTKKDAVEAYWQMRYASKSAQVVDASEANSAINPTSNGRTNPLAGLVMGVGFPPSFKEKSEKKWSYARKKKLKCQYAGVQESHAPRV